MIHVEAWYRELFAGEDMVPESRGEESLGKLPRNTQAFYVDIQQELQEIVQNGQPATMGPYTITPEQAQKYLWYLQSTPAQTAMGWLMKVFPAKWSSKRAFEDKLPGGLADEKTLMDFEPRALEQGIKVEMEHTDDRDMAREIAMDHLTEDPDYYDKLELIDPHHE